MRTRVATAALVALVAGTGLSAWSIIGNVENAAVQFTHTRAFVEESGQSLEQALQLQTTTRGDADSGVVDNPLRADYEQLITRAAATDGQPLVETVLGSVTFVVLPMLMASLGTWLAVADQRAGMLKVRATRNRIEAIAAGRLMMLLLLSAAGVAVTLVGSVLIDPWIHVGASTAEVIASLPSAPVSRVGGPLVMQVAFSWAVASGFGVLGLAAGTLARAVWPLVGIAMILLVVPLLGAHDPRNLLLHAATGPMRLSGGLIEGATPIPVAAGTAAIGLLASMLLVTAGATVPLVRRSRFA